MYEKNRHPTTNRMTSILNGTRFLYIKPFPNEKHPPRINYCGGLQCKLFFTFVNQINPKNLARSRCTSETCCKACKQPGHSPGNEACSHFQPQKHLTTFCGATDVLSNFYPCQLDIFGVTHKSAEHVFKYMKAVRCGDLDSANAIKVANDALSALRIGKKIKSDEH